MEGAAAAVAGSPGRPVPKSQPGHRSYNLHERRRIGSMTGAEQDRYQKMPTDESEAQTLASADLDYMKSELGGHPAPQGPRWQWPVTQQEPNHAPGQVFVYSGEEEAEGRPHHPLQLPERRVQRGG